MNEQPLANLSAAMAGAFAKIQAATKDSTNPHFKSKYADLGAVVEAIKPPLIEHELFFTQRSHPAENGVSVETVLHHKSGEQLSLGTLFVPANKQDAQGFGSALTYARRYGLMTAFGVPAEDNDGNAASARNGATRANGNGAHPPITDEQRDQIQALAPGAGKTVQDICEAYRVLSLKELTHSQAEKLIERLKADSKPKEPVNA